jgi:hypothetical protein
VNILLWDCAEHFYGGTAGSRWSLLTGTGDCSSVRSTGGWEDASGWHDGGGGLSIDRVHLFAVVPFTFYANLIDPSATGGPRVQGYWGNAFGNAGTCGDPVNWAKAGCGLNLFMNSAFLVPDE